MAVTASGPMSLPLERLRALLAASSTFQTWVGAEDATEAAARIFLGAREGAPTDSDRPFAVVGQGNQWQRSKLAQITYNATGSLLLLIEGAVAEGATVEDAELEFCNKVGAIVTEMEALAGTGEHINVTQTNLIEGPMRADEKVRVTEGDFYQIILEVFWGP